MQGLNGFILNWILLDFLGFYERNPCKTKKVHKNCFDEQGKPWTYLKYTVKKQQIQSHLSPSRPFKSYDFLRRATPTSSYFSATTALRWGTFHIITFFKANDYEFRYLAYLLIMTKVSAIINKANV